MVYNEKLADRIREALLDVPKATEKKMFGGAYFMVNNKMCVGVVKDKLMCRISPDVQEQSLERVGCRTMDFTGKTMKGLVFIDDEGMKSTNDFMYGINLGLDYNKLTKASKKNRKKK